jgi:hypothetical protein
MVYAVVAGLLPEAGECAQSAARCAENLLLRIWLTPDSISRHLSTPPALAGTEDL